MKPNYLALTILFVIVAAVAWRLLSRRPTNQVEVEAATLEESLAARDEFEPGWREKVRSNGR